jgi:hypothetical protein
MKQPAADLGNKEPPEGWALPCGLASLALLFGLLGLLDGSWSERIPGSRGGLHALFGLLLCSLVAVRFHRRLNWATPASQSDIRELSRELSRMVYLSLYVVIGLRQIVCLAEWSWHGGIVEFGRSSEGDLQIVVTYGIVGLLFIRVLAFGAWQHAVRGAAITIDGEYS